MNVAIELTEDIAEQLKAAWQDMPRRALEAVAVEGYRSEAITQRQVGRLLDLSYWETEAFLKQRGAYLPYDEEELRQDRAALDQALDE